MNEIAEEEIGVGVGLGGRRHARRCRVEVIADPIDRLVAEGRGRDDGRIGLGPEPEDRIEGGHHFGSVIRTRPRPMGVGEMIPANASRSARLIATAATSNAPVRQRLPRNRTTPVMARRAAATHAHTADCSAAATRPTARRKAPVSQILRYVPAIDVKALRGGRLGCRRSKGKHQ